MTIRKPVGNKANFPGIFKVNDAQDDFLQVNTSEYISINIFAEKKNSPNAKQY